MGKPIIQNEEELDRLLLAEEVFEKLRENQAMRTYLNKCEAFVYGFRLGTKIMLEVMDDSGKRFEMKD